MKKTLFSGSLATSALLLVLVGCSNTPSDTSSPTQSNTPSPTGSGVTVNGLDAAAILGTAVAAYQAPYNVPPAGPTEQEAYREALEKALNDPGSPEALDLGVPGNRLVEYKFDTKGKTGCWAVAPPEGSDGETATKPVWVLYADLTQGFQFLESTIDTCEEAAQYAATLTSKEAQAKVTENLIETLYSVQEVFPEDALTAVGKTYIEYMKTVSDK